MKLTELEAEFVGGYKENPESYRHLPSVEGAQGVLFICPKCENHSILCWFANPRNAPKVPDSVFPKPGRWTFSGETIETLTLDPSIDLSKIDQKNPASATRCYWHGFVANGEAK